MAKPKKRPDLRNGSTVVEYKNDKAVYQPCNGVMDNEEPEEIIKPVSFFALFRFGSSCDKFLVALALIFGCFAGTAIVLPFFFSARLANALMLKQNDTSSDELIEVGVFYISIDLIFGLIIFISVFIQYYAQKKACANIVANMRKEFIKSLLNQDAAWLSEQKFGAISAQFNENINTIREGIGEKLGSVVRGVASFIAAITLSFIADWQLALIPLVTGPMAIAMYLYMTKLINKAEAKQQTHLENSGAILQESVMNVATVQSCNGEEEKAEEYGVSLKEGRVQALKTYVWSGLFEGLTFCFLYFFFAADFCAGAFAYFSGRIKQPGDVFIVPNTFFNGAWTLGTVSPYFIAIVKARVAAAHIYQKIDRIPLVENCVNGQKPTKGNIEFKDVHFAYSNREEKPVLNGLSFTAEVGKTTALVSPSGGGKSTAMQLLMRVFGCNEGAVLINGVDVKQLDLYQLRRFIGVVQQEPVLFNETVADNIRLGDVDITDEMLHKACHIANAHKFISKLPLGYNTQIGPGHMTLSGGQKQRIAIARAIVYNPEILLLDEATSALDAYSESVVQASLKIAAANRTTIVIAHRLSTLNGFADKIVVIGQGKNVEEGTHKELTTKRDGVYAKLVEAQKIHGVSSNRKEPLDVVIEDDVEGDEVIDIPHDLPHISFAPSRRVRRTSERSQSSLSSSSSQYANIPPVAGFALASAHFLEHNGIHKEKESRRSPPPHKQKGGLSLLFNNLHGNYKKFISAVFVSALVGLELFFLVLLQGYMFNTMSSMNPSQWEPYRNSVFTFTVCAVMLGIFCFFTIAGSYILYGWSAERIIDKLKLRAFRSVMKKDAAYFDQPETGKPRIITNITNNPPALKPALDNRMVHVVSNASSILTLLVLAFVVCWQIASVGTAIVFIMAAVAIIANRKMQKLTDELAKVDESAKHSIEIIENVRTIQLLCREHYFVQKLSKHLNHVCKVSIQAARYEAFMFAVAMSLPFVSDAVCYGLGLWLIHTHVVSTNTVFLAATTVSFISWAIQFSSTSSAEFMKAKPAAEALFSIIDSKKAEKQAVKQGSFTKFDGRIETKGLKFSYPSRSASFVVNELDISADIGKTIAIVGPSGSGKSTVIQLVERFYDYIYGSIMLDGREISSYDRHHLRNDIALVGQEPVLFSGTIYKSITLGVPNVTHEEVVQACRVADAAGFINQLPKGYETEVGEKGTQLSGGQKQRLAIARAIIRKPKILLLDEATSALDAESEQAVQQALDNASADRTCIIIAHRLSTIQNADRIYFIQEGKAIESGTHDELMAKEGEYFKLIQKQSLSD